MIKANISIKAINLPEFFELIKKPAMFFNKLKIKNTSNDDFGKKY
jgi:hypothetical protein